MNKSMFAVPGIAGEGIYSCLYCKRRIEDGDDLFRIGWNTDSFSSYLHHGCYKHLTRADVRTQLMFRDYNILQTRNAWYNNGQGIR